MTSHAAPSVTISGYLLLASLLFSCLAAPALSWRARKYKGKDTHVLPVRNYFRRGLPLLQQGGPFGKRSEARVNRQFPGRTSAFPLLRQGGPFGKRSTDLDDYADDNDVSPERQGSVYDMQFGQRLTELPTDVMSRPLAELRHQCAVFEASCQEEATDVCLQFLSLCHKLGGSDLRE